MLKGVDIWKSFRTGIVRGRTIEVLRGVSIEIAESETVALLGESGCGKTTLGRVLLLLLKPDRGKVVYRGRDLTALNRKELRPLRRKLQLIPQNPEEALDPRWRVYDSIAEPLRIHGLVESREEEKSRVYELIELVGLKEEHLNRIPAELSGGELQRVAIARALALEPDFVVCDEPTSMLDISTQASIVRLLMDLQTEKGISYLFITHDAELASVVADRILVMGGGKIIKELKPEELRESTLLRCSIRERAEASFLP